MAYIFTGRDDSILVNVSGAVGSKEVGTGKMAENRPTDVMLVHFFLSSLYLLPSKLPRNPTMVNYLRTINHDPRPWNDIGVTSLLSKAILLFQNDRNKIQPNPRVYPDGRVDQIHGDGFDRSSITHTRYTIMSLQALYVLSKGKSAGTDIRVDELILVDPFLTIYPLLKSELEKSQ
jgi:hypothetical protein